MVWIRPDMKTPSALTIAGIDPSGGAGISADLKTFSAIGIHGCSVVTAITVQSTMGIEDVKPVEPELVRRQIKAVLEDVKIKAIKIGVIYTPENAKVIQEELDGQGIPIVLDPILISTTGQKLIKDVAIRTMIDELLPISTIITPNIHEAEVLSGIKIRTIDDAKRAAKRIHDLGTKAVLIKGGHLKSDQCTDILYYKEDYYYLKMERIKSDEIHGTGCSLSAAIAGFIVLDFSIIDAVRRAKEFVYYGIINALDVGKGNKIINPLANLYKESERFNVLSELWKAFNELRKMKGIVKFVPETRMNFVYSLPKPLGENDVAGFPGRITSDGSDLYAISRPWFGASKHVARVVITANDFDRNIRSAINIKYSKELVDSAKKANLFVAKFDRRDEPRDIKEREGMTLSWGVRYVIEKYGRVPDVIYDLGDVGKEPMIRILGKNPIDVLNKLKMIFGNLSNKI